MTKSYFNPKFSDLKKRHGYINWKFSDNYGKNLQSGLNIDEFKKKSAFLIGDYKG